MSDGEEEGEGEYGTDDDGNGYSNTMCFRGDSDQFNVQIFCNPWNEHDWCNNKLCVCGRESRRI